MYKKAECRNYCFN